LERLQSLIDPATTAVVTMELQQGVVGEFVLLTALRDECLAKGVLANAGRVCAAGRQLGARVVHNVAAQRNDGQGWATNCRIFGLGEKQRAETGHYPTELGTPGGDPVPELGVAPSDVIVSRMHGMSPFMSTSLDQVLRNMGVKTIIGMGVSVNLGVFGLTLNAVDLGYQVVIVRDGIAGVPREYAESVIENSLSMLATVVTADELLAAWGIP
jgi:nicotinamidase-related amidase